MIKPLRLMFCINNTLGLQSEASKINVKIVSIRKYYISVGFLVLSSFFWKQMQNKIKKNPQNVLVYFITTVITLGCH